MAFLDSENELTRRRRPGIPGNPLAPTTPTTGLLPMGNPFGGQTPTSQPPPAGTPPVSQPRTTKVSSVMSGSSAKLNDPTHALKSPKYSFLQRAPFYGRGEENQLLKDLQGDANVGRFWQGWNFDGRGNFVYGGNPAQLAPEWNGVTRVDAYNNYNAGGPLEARWGLGTPAGGGTSTSLQQLLAQLSAPQVPVNLWDTPRQLDPIPPGWTMPENPNGPYVPMSTPGYQAPADQPNVTGAPSPLTLGAGGMPESLRLLAMQLPQLIQQRGVQDPLVQQLLRQLGGR